MYTVYKDTTIILSTLKIAPLFKTWGQKKPIVLAFVHTQVTPLNKTQGLEYSCQHNILRDFDPN